MLILAIVIRPIARILSNDCPRYSFIEISYSNILQLPLLLVMLLLPKHLTPVIKGITAFREYTAIASTVTAANIIDISSLDGI